VPASSLHRPLRRSAAFTLLELLVVVGIIALLLAVTLPAISSLSKSSSRKGTVSLLLGIIEQARAMAIKDGRASYIALAAQPTDGTTSINDNGITDRYFYRAVAVFQDDANDPSKKVQLTAWSVFPTGICLRTEISFSGASTAAWSSSDFAFTPAGTQSQKFPFIKFDETGALASPIPTGTGPLLLRFFEGSVKGTTEQPTNKANKDEVISLARVTGRATYIPVP
jgi:prepilin-type N-terminal cleavage/methylation domain-containing protein